jgi:hypothetical protein
LAEILLDDFYPYYYYTEFQNKSVQNEVAVRIQRGYLIWKNGGVSRSSESVQDIYSVESSSSNGMFCKNEFRFVLSHGFKGETITYSVNTYARICTCGDYLYRGMDCKHGFAAAFFKANGLFSASLENSISLSGSSVGQTRYERQRQILESQSQICSESQFQLNPTHLGRPSMIMSLLQRRNPTPNTSINEIQFSSKRGRKRTRRH